MAANMIGVKKRILVFTIGGSIIVPMVNPVIIKKENRYEIEESCLSLTGFRKTTRYEKIEVEYLDKDFKKQKQGTNRFISEASPVFRCFIYQNICIASLPFAMFY